MKPYALVLGGGGARGIYQIGAWKALRELGCKFNAVIGTSIGTINGCFIIQENIQKAIKFWMNIEIDNALNIPSEMIQDNKLNINTKNLDLLVKLQESIIKNMGVDTAPLYRKLQNHISEQKIRRSSIDFGVVSFNLSTLKPFECFKESIPNGMLVDYLMASSALPGLKKVVINNSHMLDGGLTDVVPYDLARRRGYKHIIAIDVSGPGNYKKPHIIGTETIYIKNSSDLGGLIETDKSIYKRNLEMGYYDTMKVFDRYKGVKYTYKENRSLKKKINGYIEEYSDNLYQLIADNNEENLEVSNLDKIRNLFPNQYAMTKDIAEAISECAASALKIPNDRLYNYEELVHSIAQSYKKLKTKSKTYEDYTAIDLLKKVIKDKQNIFSLSILEYDFVLDFFLRNKSLSDWVPGKHLKIIFEEIYAAKIFFYLVDNAVI